MAANRVEYTLPSLTLEQWGYVAGFLDGDGCLSTYKKKGRKVAHKIIFSQKSLAPLRLLRRWLNTGGIYVANKHRESGLRAGGPISNYQISSYWAVRKILGRIAPLLVVKKAKALRILKQVTLEN